MESGRVDQILLEIQEWLYEVLSYFSLLKLDMKRRDLALLMLTPGGPTDDPAFCPSDPERLNAFAIVWNEYVRQLTEGKLDYKLWRAAQYHWGRLR